MKISRIAFAAFLICHLADLSLAGAAQGSEAVLTARAMIQPFLNVSLNQQTSSFEVTEQDLQRGYVDFPGAVIVNLQTNIKRRIYLAISGREHQLSIVSEGAQKNEIVFEQMEIQVGEIMSKTLDIRITLSKDSTAGSFPLQIYVTPSVY